MHGFGDNVIGTLSLAALNQPAQDGDWVGCAQAPVAAGMPAVRPDPDSTTGGVLLGEQGHRSLFSEEETEYLLGSRQRRHRRLRGGGGGPAQLAGGYLPQEGA